MREASLVLRSFVKSGLHVRPRLVVLSSPDVSNGSSMSLAESEAGGPMMLPKTDFSLFFLSSSFGSGRKI